MVALKFLSYTLLESDGLARIVLEPESRHGIGGKVGGEVRVRFVSLSTGKRGWVTEARIRKVF